MAVKYILEQAGLKVGLNPQAPGDRAVLLRYLNEAASEAYDQADVDDMLFEGLFQCNGDQQIALPPDVGPLRAMREYSTHVTWRLERQRNRYNPVNWKNRWRNWREKGTSPIMYPVVNQSTVTITVPTIENPPIAISVTGPTQAANSISETIIMDASSKSTIAAFMNITALKKDRVNTLDVTVKDADSTVLAVIPNNMLQMRYRLLDVSLYPWTSTAQSAVDHWMEVLYKQALPWLSNDEDEYPAIGYDNILVNKVLQLWAEEQGKGSEAIAYDAKATRSMARKKEDQNRGVQDEAVIDENPHDTLLPRNRPLGPARYSGQVWY